MLAATVALEPVTACSWPPADSTTPVQRSPFREARTARGKVKGQAKMPHLLAADNGETSRSRSRQRARTEVSEHRSVWDRLNLHKIGAWLKRDDDTPPLSPKLPKHDDANKENGRPHSSAGLLHRRTSRKVVPGLPRPLTFKRMNSEKRDKLLEVPAQAEPKRAASVDRRGSTTTTTKRNLSPPPQSIPSMSAPDVLNPHESDILQKQRTLEEQRPQKEAPTIGGGPDSNIPAGARQVDYGVEEDDYMPKEVDPVHQEKEFVPKEMEQIPREIEYIPTGDPPPVDIADAYSEHGSHRTGSDIDDIQLQEELEAKWILNLSMHFRDMSDREKFFITFAEEPNKWRRVTVSCDYRHLEPDSLEADLKTLHYQRDKSSRIYEAIRDSLPDIQFYDTVTNLKLETADGRLHVHVTEDVNEIIPYPPTSAIDHLDCKRFRETAVSFDSHISGFVYKVSINNRAYIKKEIPGPDAVEEFLYEINALCSLHDAKSVIRFEGVIVDEQNELIKGLVISYAEQGALVDMIYDYKPTGQLHWERRERWARQIVQGLSEIHEAGFVQGDFTLSNIVIDHNDDAKIIDINRRGCPVGWEPPELAKLIESGQRISIYIGVKSDLYQLGMVLWALAEQQDEPERQERPLTRSFSRHNSDIPSYFKDIIRACLSDAPRNRPSATDLLKKFPDHIQEQDPRAKVPSRESVSTHRSDREYIDPATAVDLEDISHHHHLSRGFEEVHRPRTEYPESTDSFVMPQHNDVHRGRSPHPPRSSSRNRRSDCSPYPGHRSVMSLDDSELENELASLPASRETRWEQVYVDGDTKLVQRGCGEVGVHDFATQDPKGICITTPPSEMENSFLTSKADDTPLTLSQVAELQPIEPQITIELQPTITLQPTIEIQPDLESPRLVEIDPIVGHLPEYEAQPETTVELSPEPLPIDKLPRTFERPRSIELQPAIESQPTQSSLQRSPKKGHHRGVGSKASFSDRVHQLAQSQTHIVPTDTQYHHNRHSQMPDSTTLADLEHELAMDSSVASSAAPSRAETGFSIFDRPEYPTPRVGTGFSVATGHHMPLHQDSGFVEPERVSYESERIRHSLDESIRALRLSFHEDDDEKIHERLWDEKDGTLFGEGGSEQGRESRVDATPTPMPMIPTTPASPSKSTKAPSTSTTSAPIPSVGPSNIIPATDLKDKALEERSSNTTIRPPSIYIPSFHRGIPKAIDSLDPSPPNATPASEYTVSVAGSQHPYYDAFPEKEEVKEASDDLADYLSHSISYEHLDEEEDPYEREMRREEQVKV